MSAVQPPILQISIRSMIRGAKDLLQGVDWTILPGEHWALLGANGSGKTSLLKVICGYEWPTEGEVSVLGRRFGATDLRELRKSIGLVSSALVQRFPEGETALEVAMSGLEASIGLWREFVEDERELAFAALDLIGATAIADRPWGVLSQGERQRVMIARSLVNQPALLILDEPCGGLDPLAREYFLEDLARLAEGEGAPSVILVTHHIEEIPPFMDKALVLREGRTLAAGPITEVVTPEILGRAFGRPCEIERIQGRYWMRMHH